MFRFNVLLLTIGTTLFASAANALPQSGGGSGYGRATTVRTRCSSCSARDSAARQRQERLLLRIDSLRWIIDNQRLSDAEREQAAQEIGRTVLALQQSLDETVRAEAAVVAGAAPRAFIVQEPIGAQRMAVVAVGAFQPRGYLGLTFDGPNEDIIRDNERFIRFYRYPKIALVESSSPAEKAGVREGDTLLALNGTNVLTETFNLTKLLVPETRIVMRVRRDGDNKDLKVTVGKAPEYYTWRSNIPRPALPTDPGRVRVREAPPAPQARPPIPATPFPEARIWAYSEGIAGAHVETISEGLGKALGAKEGVLVIRAQPGTPAFDSGLRDGDIILRVDGRGVANVRVLRRLLIEGDHDAGVKLVILRERKERELTLRW